MRKGIFSFGALALVIATALVFAVFDSSVTQARENPAPQTALDPSATVDVTNVFECFSVQKGVDPKAVVRLITKNFGGDLVAVRNLVVMCEFAYKVPLIPGTVAPPPVDPPPDDQVIIMACYRVTDGTNPNDPFFLTTRNFKTLAVNVQQSNLMCESATKTRTTGTTAGPPVTKTTGSVDPAVAMIWQCYNLGKGQHPAQPFTLVTNNFGSDAVTIGNSTEMCETAQKDRQTTDAAGNVIVTHSGSADPSLNWQCFAIRSGKDANVTATLFTNNFGSSTVQIRRPVWMCESAQKTPILTLPASTAPLPVLPGIDTNDD